MELTTIFISCIIGLLFTANLIMNVLKRYMSTADLALFASFPGVVTPLKYNSINQKICILKWE